jgi:hypothetical protein
MTKRSLLWTAVGVLLLCAFACLVSLYGTHSVSFTEAQVREHLSKQVGKEMPIKGTAQLLVKSVTIKQADVRIQDGRVLASIHVEGQMKTGKKFMLSTNTVGVPSYAEGAFFFKPEKVEVEKFGYEGGSPKEAISRFADRYVSDNKLRTLAEDVAPKVEEWVTNLAQNTSIYALERWPVYRLKDDVKGVVIKASLESVKVDKDRIVVTFSLWQLTVSVFFGIAFFLLALGLAWAMIQNPLLGTGVLLLTS